MITDEFNNYFRLCSNRALTTQETLTLFIEVSNVATTSVNEDVSMLYRVDSETNNHCYDVKLTQNVSYDQADEILNNLKTTFLNNSLEYIISK
jgi:hypothetical protein